MAPELQTQWLDGVWNVICNLGQKYPRLHYMGKGGISVPSVGLLMIAVLFLDIWRKERMTKLIPRHGSCLIAHSRWTRDRSRWSGRQEDCAGRRCVVAVIKLVVKMKARLFPLKSGWKWRFSVWTRILTKFSLGWTASWKAASTSPWVRSRHVEP